MKSVTSPRISSRMRSHICWRSSGKAKLAPDRGIQELIGSGGTRRRLHRDGFGALGEGEHTTAFVKGCASPAPPFRGTRKSRKKPPLHSPSHEADLPAQEAEAG